MEGFAIPHKITQLVKCADMYQNYRAVALMCSTVELDWHPFSHSALSLVLLKYRKFSKVTQFLICKDNDIIIGRVIASISEAFLRMNLQTCKLGISENEWQMNIILERKRLYTILITISVKNCVEQSWVFSISVELLMC